MKTSFQAFALFAFAALLFAAVASAQDIQTGVYYLCNGERITIDSCNMRDTSDTSRCMVGHPDTILPNGLMKYTSETRGDLKKLLPSCKQPSAAEMAHAQAFNKKVQDTQDANQKKAEDELNAREAQAQAQIQAMASGRGQQKPQTPEERAITRCITSGRLPASCTGNALLGAFGQMLSSVLPTTPEKQASAGPNMAGVFEGAGNWRLDFIDDGVLVNCSGLSPNQESYHLEFRNDRTLLVIDTKPKPLVLTLRADGTIVGPGPVTIDGVVASSGGGGNYANSFAGNYHNANGGLMTDAEAANSSEVFDSSGNRVYNARNATQQTTFLRRTATCPALNLSSKGTGAGIQTMETDLLKTAFGGDKGPPTPPGIRMHGIFAAPTGFSVQFFPESAVLGCGPDAARAYPYSVVADASKAVIQIAAPDHPLALAFNPDGSLAPSASGAYRVHGRTITGQNDNDDFTFAPMERSCDLAVLTPSKEIPSNGGNTATMTASAPGSAPARPAGTPALATPAAPTGNATLTIVSGLPAQPNTPNPLAGRSLVLLRDSYADALAKGGVAIPQGMSPVQYVRSTCTSRTPDCQKVFAAINVDAASAARADVTGGGTLPGVPAGTYYLMISTLYNNQQLSWGFPVVLKPGANSVTLDQRNVTPVN